VRELLNLADTQGFKLDPLGKARVAESNRLPKHALEQLENSVYEVFGVEGAALELNLLLHAGRADRVRAMMDPNRRPRWEP